MEGSAKLKYGIFVMAQCCGFIAFIIMITVLSDCGGIDWSRSVNVHALCMFLGMVYLQGIAISAFRVITFLDRPIIKMIHMAVNAGAMVLAIVALSAILDPNITFSLHGVIGIITFSLFGLQWLVGFFSFLFPKLDGDMRATLMPFHRAGGAVIFSFAVITAVVGINNYSSISPFLCLASITYRNHSHDLIAAGVFTMLYGLLSMIFVLTKFFKSEL